MTPEDEEFTRIEMESRVKQEYVKSLNRKRQIAETRDENNRMIDAHQAHVIQLMDELAIARIAVRELGDRLSKAEKTQIQIRNETLDEVAHEFERLAIAFGVDTVHSFMIFVREMKE
jgi:broad-specificity NMP kinase